MLSRPSALIPAAEGRMPSNPKNTVSTVIPGPRIRILDGEDLWDLTSQVAANNGYRVEPSASDTKVMNFLRSKIKHIIYVVKENRTFDQILGDLGNGSARVNRGLSYEGEGQNRNIPANLNSTAARDFFYDPTGATTPYSDGTSSLKGGTANILAGDGDHAATDGPTGYQQGYIFNAVLNTGGTVRNYGWMANTPGSIGTIANPISDPFAAGVIQTTTANQLLLSEWIL
jgi:hypothetical protein